MVQRPEDDQASGDHVRIVVLDGIKVAAGDVLQPLQPHEAHALLVLVAAGRPVTADDLAEFLWRPHERPASPNRPQKIISGLRRALGKRRVPLRDRAYRLELDEDAGDLLDLAWVRKIVTEAQRATSPDPGAAVLLYEHVLEMFTGVPSGLPDTPRMNTLARRLTDEWLQIVTSYQEVRLQLGQYAQVADDLAFLVDRFPERERLLLLRMRALHHSQRGPEALDAYDRYRQRQSHTPPSPELVHLRQQIRDGNPSLVLKDFEPPEPDRNVYASRGDTSNRGNHFRMSGHLTNVAAWAGYSGDESMYHTAADRAALTLLMTVAPSVVTIQYEAVDLARHIANAAVEAGIRQFLELGALVPTTVSIYNAGDRLHDASPPLRTLYLNPEAPLVRYARRRLDEDNARRRAEGRPAHHATFLHGTLATIMAGHIRLQDYFDLSEPVLVVNQHENGIQQDIAAYAKLYHALSEQLAPGSWMFCNAVASDGISPAARLALHRMYQGVNELQPHSRASIEVLVPPGWVRQTGPAPTTDVWEEWTGWRSPEQNRPGALPRIAFVAKKPLTHAAGTAST